MGEQEVKREKPGCGGYLCAPLGWIGVAMALSAISGHQYSMYFLFGGLFLYLVYLAEALLLSKASGYLSNVLSEKEFTDYVRRIQAADPRLDFSITCYHYEEKTHVSTDSNGHTHTRTTRERVNTHSASMRYPVQGHVDETLSPQQTLAMFHLLNDGQLDSDPEKAETNLKDRKPKSMILLCKFPLEFHPTSDFTEQHFANTRDTFWQQNTRDQHQDKGEQRSVDGHEKHIMVILQGGTDDSTERPWWMACWVLVVCSVCLMSLPYRLFLFSKCDSTEWTVLKHFSHEPVQADQEPPKHSRMHRADAASRAFRAVPRESGGVGGGPINIEFPGRPAEPAQLQVSSEVPKYWKNQDLSARFDEKIKLPDADTEKFQQVVDQTFKAKATRDREGEPMPTKLVIKQVLRMEDANLWSRYAAKRCALASLGGSTPVQDLPGSGPLKTAQFLDLSGSGEAVFPASVDDFAPEVNEAYLFHGTSPGGALGIGEDGFNLGMVGSNVGTMFGAGAYFAEASSKSDEYASEDPQGVFAGKQALILCRVLLGNPFYITNSDIPQIEQALASGSYDSVLGDREAVVDTYRELVVFDQAQIYPEYIIIYEREF